MKHKFLEDLKYLLSRYDMDSSEITDILNDYEDMYDNYIDLGMTEEEAIDKLGEPKKIYKELVQGYKRKKQKSDSTSKIIALSPFVALIIFLVSSFLTEKWELTWMAFLLIPITAIIVEMVKKKDKHVFTALSPFIALIAYFIVSFTYENWEVSWMIFLLIPVVAIIQSRKEMAFLHMIIALSPFAAILLFFYFGFEGYWQQAWLFFLITPLLGGLTEKTLIRKVLVVGLISLGIASYLYIGYQYSEWNLALFSFVPAVLYLLAIGKIIVHFGYDEASKDYKILIVVTVLVYLLISLLFGYWHITWMIFFAIPVYAIYKSTSGGERYIAISPFVALVIFFLVGFFFDAFHLSWTAFLLIPMVAIIASNE